MKDAASCVLKIYKGLRWFEYYSQFGELSIVLGSISWKAIDDKGRYIKEIYRKSLQIAQVRREVFVSLPPRMEHPTAPLPPPLPDIVQEELGPVKRVLKARADAGDSSV